MMQRDYLEDYLASMQEVTTIGCKDFAKDA